MASNLQKYLSALNGAVPDLGELKRLNVPLQKAIAICEAAAKAEPKPAPLVKAPEPLPFAEPEPRIISTHVLPAAPLREPLAKKQTGIAGMTSRLSDRCPCPPRPRRASNRSRISAMNQSALRWPCRFYTTSPP